ncbi:hypothetical protein L7F22_063718 [Adiantum nelumboides]|nr:hypothetical protein [Adiantum nelumboides]
MQLALELVDKSYDLSASSNAKHITIRLADECLEDPRCDFMYFKALKTKRGPFEHSSTSRMVSRFALELAGKSYGLPASSNASRMVIRLADGCSEDPRCNFTQSKALKTQRRLFEHPSARRFVMRLVLELANKSYDLPENFNASHITIRLADECLKDQEVKEDVHFMPYMLPTVVYESGDECYNEEEGLEVVPKIAVNEDQIIARFEDQSTTQVDEESSRDQVLGDDRFIEGSQGAGQPPSTLGVARIQVRRELSLLQRQSMAMQEMLEDEPISFEEEKQVYLKAGKDGDAKEALGVMECKRLLMGMLLKTSFQLVLWQAQVTLEDWHSMETVLVDSYGITGEVQAYVVYEDLFLLQNKAGEYCRELSCCSLCKFLADALKTQVMDGLQSEIESDIVIEIEGEIEIEIEIKSDIVIEIESAIEIVIEIAWGWSRGFETS